MVSVKEYINESIRCLSLLKDMVGEIDEITEIIKKSKLIYIAGNGGSSATASHMANDFYKMCNKNCICLSDNTPLLTAIANDIDYTEVFKEQINKELIDNLGKENIVLIVLSGSGNSHNILSAIYYAQKLGIQIIAFIGGDGGIVKHCENVRMIHVNTDMQHSEDLQLILCHMITRKIYDNLDKRKPRRVPSK